MVNTRFYVKINPFQKITFTYIIIVIINFLFILTEVSHYLIENGFIPFIPVRTISFKR